MAYVLTGSGSGDNFVATGSVAYSREITNLKNQITAIEKELETLGSDISSAQNEYNSEGMLIKGIIEQYDADGSFKAYYQEDGEMGCNDVLLPYLKEYVQVLNMALVGQLVRSDYYATPYTCSSIEAWLFTDGKIYVACYTNDIEWFQEHPESNEAFRVSNSTLFLPSPDGGTTEAEEVIVDMRKYLELLQADLDAITSRLAMLQARKTELLNQKADLMQQLEEYEDKQQTYYEFAAKYQGMGRYDPISGTDKSTMKSELAQELMSLEGIHGQNPETGAGIGAGETFLQEYTNRIFGAPYQLLDSVDRRFTSINKYLGTEYLRNFILNSPILYVKPGLPHYTGGEDGSKIVQSIKNAYIDTESGNMSFIDSFLESLASSTIFGIGSKLQKRMYGIREAYNDYMNHVNYMCRSMAIYLDLTCNDDEVNDIGLPNGIFIKEDTFEHFTSMRWENYRMLSSTRVLDNWEYLQTMLSSTAIGALATTFAKLNPIDILINSINEFNTGEYQPTAEEAITATGNTIMEQWNAVCDAWTTAGSESIADQVMDKVTTVQFMVEPVSFTERVNNHTRNSMIEDTVDGLKNSIGNELAFILNSNTDTGILGNLFEFLGDAATSAAMSLNDLMSSTIGGGFLHNFFSGAIQSIKGQKMIYPSIYESTETSMTYEYNMTLSVPYGDVYNYYTGICVPLAHVIALAVPRMVTSNSVTSPYLVQTYIPGMCTCNMGIISDLTITKNPSKTHVSVQGFPLTIEINFTVTELYNSLSISPANDPSSFLFNETLNDYLSNLAGLMPSIDTYTNQRKVMFQGLNEYFNPDQNYLLGDLVAPFVSTAEGIANPFIGR